MLRYGKKAGKNTLYVWKTVIQSQITHSTLYNSLIFVFMMLCKSINLPFMWYSCQQFTTVTSRVLLNILWQYFMLLVWTLQRDASQSIRFTLLYSKFRKNVSYIYLFVDIYIWMRTVISFPSGHIKRCVVCHYPWNKKNLCLSSKQNF